MIIQLSDYARFIWKQCSHRRFIKRQVWIECRAITWLISKYCSFLYGPLLSMAASFPWSSFFSISVGEYTFPNLVFINSTQVVLVYLLYWWMTTRSFAYRTSSIAISLQALGPVNTLFHLLRLPPCELIFFW